MRTRRWAAALVGCGLVVIAVCALAAGAIRWISGPSGACRRPATGLPQPGLSARTLVSGGMTRCYLLYVPDGPSGDFPTPLIVSLHGFASRPEGQVFLTGWNALADEEGFLVVYPQGTGFPLRWNAFSQLDRTGADDVRYLQDVLDDVGSLWAIDPDRVFLNGMSNGGAMTHRLACEIADRVAAVGIVAGPNIDPPDGCHPARPMPVVSFYGTADPLVRYAGGTLRSSLLRRLNADVMYPGAQAWIAGWADRNGCAPSPAQEQVAADVGLLRYGSCAGGADALLYTVEAGGHTWPGGPRLPYLGATTSSVDATRVMWSFFRDHPLP